ncbi:hypothetical protein EPL59_23175 [Salmonella enterica subsp. enterica serovar Strasbourg]|uniref:Uncharacterized protein n=2 Tax=Salmonella enterica TaxID=28901 RepID=A0A5X7K979_SALET|nr:hypothetical protein [Salmonella enterica subsp. enterica serovar Coquilhatville]ECA7543693.1 hypothetical protein [Salmonella enterica subsp. enterica serovar Strasbourg]
MIMKKIEDVCLGNIEFINSGNDLSFDIWSTYDGCLLYKVQCRKVSKFEFKNDLGDGDDFFGVYVPLLKINNSSGIEKSFVSMESGDLFIMVECQDVICNKL